MKKIFIILFSVFIFMTLFTFTSFADNPVVQTIFTADPAPKVVKSL